MTASRRPADTRPADTRPADTRPASAPDPRRPGGEGPGAGPGPDPATLLGRLAIRWVEVRDRRRPLQQLEPFLAPALRHRLRIQLAPLPAPPWQPVTLVRVHPSGGSYGDVYEASVVITQAGRTTALAARLERHLGRWRLVELTAPEAGFAPLPTASLAAGAHRRDAFDEVLELPEPA